MKNVEMHVEGNILTIRIDLSKEYGPSSSGPSSSPLRRGTCLSRNARRRLGLNVYRKK